MEEIVFKVVTTFIMLVVFALVFCFAVLMLDSVQEWRAYDAIQTCKVKRMEPQRRQLTKRVTCTPINTRQDTSTVRINIKQ